MDSQNSSFCEKRTLICPGTLSRTSGRRIPIKSIILVLDANRATLSGPKSKQHKIRQNAKAFAKRLRREGFGVQKWSKIPNKHFAAIARQMKDEGKSDELGRMIEAAKPKHRPYLWGLRETMARSIEVQRLTWNRVNLEERYVEMETLKNKRENRIAPHKV